MKHTYRLNRDVPAEIEAIRRNLEAPSDVPVDDVEIDLSDAGFLDSSALGAILRLHMDLQRRGMILTLVNLNDRARTVFRHSSLDRILKLGPGELTPP